MLTVDQAIDAVLDHCAAPFTSSAIECPLLDAVGAVLAADVVSDVDLPPFSRSTMDGFALRTADAQAGARLRITGESAAGASDPGAVESGAAVRIFTGAPLPEGADTVVMVEKTSEKDGVVTLSDGVVAGQNISRRGEDLRSGNVAVVRGTSISTAHVGLMASIGAATVRVFPRPRVAILATGSELVPADQQPAAGQIRESNGAQTAALVRQAGCIPVPLGIVSDDADKIRERTRQAMEADVVVLSGGSSVGDYDFTPDVLRDLGVTIHFDRVSLKPGKPTLFGTRDKTIVFGMPGNPISAFVVFHLFVRPALKKRLGVEQARPPLFPARLVEAVRRNAKRQQFLPARLAPAAEGWTAQFVGWHGSGDVTCIAPANALLVVPAGDGDLPEGSPVLVSPIDAGSAGGIGLGIS